MARLELFLLGPPRLQRDGVLPTVASLWRRVRGLESSDAAKSTDSAAGKLEAVSGESQSAE